MKKLFLLLFSSILFLSCDKDYNDIGANLLGDNHFNASVDRDATIIAYTKKNGPIQSNNLEVNSFGIFDNPVFGKTTSSMVTQVQLASVAPTLDPTLSRYIQSVILYIPYYSTLQSVASDGSGTYTLNNIIGGDPTTSKMKLSVYENQYTMETLDADSNLQDVKRFYTDQENLFTSNMGIQILNNDNGTSANPNTQNSQFYFDSSEIVETTLATSTTAAVTTRKAPGMYLKLDTAFFDSKILHATTDQLLNNGNFVRWFKGLYFKIEQYNNTPTCMALMNFRKGTITVNYKEDITTTPDPATRVDKSIVLNLNGTSVNLIKNDFGVSGTTYNSLPSIGDTAQGDDRLYLKGGEGSTAVIDLFTASNQLTTYRNKGWIINEANLIFNIDQTAMGTNTVEPDRIFVYDLNNRRPMIDYYYDNTTSSVENANKYIHGGIIEKDNTGRGTRYKVKITNYIRNLLNKDIDSTNIKLGVSVCQSISNVNTLKAKSAPAYSIWKTLPAIQKNSYFYPSASVISPLGTVLYGSNIPATDPNYDKRLRLEIFYTKPN